MEFPAQDGEFPAVEMPSELLEMDEATLVQFVEAAKSSSLVRGAIKMWAWKNNIKLEGSFIDTLMKVPSPVVVRMLAIWRDHQAGSPDELIAALRDDPVCREALTALAAAQQTT